MCGIIGVYSIKEKIVDPLNKALDVLGHRGPDERDIWISNCQRYGLGHTRLSIIDLDHGKQPLTTKEGLSLAVNGELYDYKDIRQQFENEGYQFSTKSDSEIIFPLWEKHGLDLFQFLRGEFAFLLVNPRNRRLIAARDRFGIKPLFYYIDGNKIVFASEIKALLAYGVEARWNQEYALSAITNFVMDNNASLFENIKSIPPGHYLEILDGELKIDKYWDYDYNSTENNDFDRDEFELIEEYRAKFYNAVNTRLIADVPVGVYLSGGLDSASILGAACKISPHPVKAFTICFNDKNYNEELQAEEMATHASAELFKFKVDEKTLAENFSKALWNAETFFTNSHGIAKFLLSKFVHDNGIKAVLTGEGADEHLAGYVHFKQDYLRDRFPRTEERKSFIEKLIEQNQVSRGLLLSEQSVDIPAFIDKLGFVPAFFETIAPACPMIRELFSESVTNKFPIWHGVEKLMANINVDAIKDANCLHKSMYVWSKTILPGYLLSVLGDRMEMAHSIEARLPFLDHSLVEFLQKVPSNLKINDATEKYIHRQALRPELTDTIYKRQKHPFLAPPAALKTEGPLFNYFKEVIFDPSFENLPFINTQKVRHLVNNIEQMPIEQRQRIDPILTVLVSMGVLGQIYSIT